MRGTRRLLCMVGLPIAGCEGPLILLTLGLILTGDFSKNCGEKSEESNG